MRQTRVHEMVKEVLTTYPETRNSDELLQSRVLEKFYGIEFLYQPYVITLQNSTLPKIESVGRARRKCQELYPELRADDDTEAARELKEEEFEDYAKRGK